jgi:ribosomal protein L11 methyltransferase
LQQGINDLASALQAESFIIQRRISQNSNKCVHAESEISCPVQNLSENVAAKTMLRAPHTRYSRIYTYHVDTTGFPAINDPDLIGVWVEDDKTIFIFHAPKETLIQDLCRQFSCNLFYQADLEYTDWEMGRDVTPFSVGPLTVAPIWEPSDADILIDPSVVFGNGFHPSTRLCLESLVSYQTKLPKGFTALDLGCGTGLLSIGAAWLGASTVLAVDHNPLACDVAKQNVLYNRVNRKIFVQQLDLRKEFPFAGVDIIMANLHTELLTSLFTNPSFWQADLYIISGFMANAEEQLLAALPGPPPRFLERRILDKWLVWIMGSH